MFTARPTAALSVSSTWPPTMRARATSTPVDAGSPPQPSADRPRPMATTQDPCFMDASRKAAARNVQAPRAGASGDLNRLGLRAKPALRLAMLDDKLREC